MTGKSHTDAGAKPFALSVMQHMNDKCNAWKKAENIDYSLYGTPLESTTYKFAKCLQKRFGIVPGITDKNYITNSYHVHVSEQIDAFTKLKFESDFQRLSPGGAISYVEVPNMQDNLEAVISVLQFIYDNIMYAELNTKSDYCQGYIGTQFWTHQHTGADAQPADGQDDQVHHRASNALGRQGVLPDEAARDDGIHRIICQLQPVAQQQRHRIKNRCPSGAPFVISRISVIDLPRSRPQCRWGGA